MSDTNKIKKLITSTEKTKKITKAMELVAASKLGKTQASMSRGRPYADAMNQMIRHVAHSHSEYRHPFLENRQPDRQGYIVIASDRGLCGGLNNNLFRKILQNIKQDQNVDVCLIGRKASQFFKRLDVKILAKVDGIGDQPELSEVLGITQNMIKAYLDGKISHVTIAYNRFVNTMVQTPVCLQLLPIPEERLLADSANIKQDTHWDYLYEPEASIVMDLLFERYIESQVYQAVIENIACEQAARMIAMKNAKDNAQKAIDCMELEYNRARQANITQELSEIVSGAEAIN